MGCGELAAPRRVVAKDVERVFDDVVPGRADDVHEQLAGKFGQPEAGADLAAVEDDARRPGAAVLAPLGEPLPCRRTSSASRRRPAP